MLFIYSKVTVSKRVNAQVCALINNIKHLGSPDKARDRDVELKQEPAQKEKAYLLLGTCQQKRRPVAVDQIKKKVYGTKCSLEIWT